MPAYYDEKTKSWYCKFYYTDYTGTRKQKKKRGFKLQRDAREWERNFLETMQADITISFKNFVSIYLEDMRHRLREHTFLKKSYIIQKKLVPFFGELPMAGITPATIRKWQNEITSYRGSDGKPYSQTYLRSINRQLSAVMNYAVNYHGLKENPCRKAGSIGKSQSGEKQFWTPEEFKAFLEQISDKPHSRAGFLVLFYTGVRIGELLALEYRDIDFDSHTITISKSYQRLHRMDVITPPKTQKSNRVISVPAFLLEELRAYTDRIYGLRPDQRIFPYTKYFYEKEINRGTASGAVKRIRLHDLRHSHASLLIELGFSPVAIADRLGHENIETTLNTYSHLFPKKRDEIADRLQKLF